LSLPCFLFLSLLHTLLPALLSSPLFTWRNKGTQVMTRKNTDTHANRKSHCIYFTAASHTYSHTHRSPLSTHTHTLTYTHTHTRTHTVDGASALERRLAELPRYTYFPGT
jgi:hypothetical protein